VALSALTDEPPRCEPIRPREERDAERQRADRSEQGRGARPCRCSSHVVVIADRCAARSHGPAPGPARRGRGRRGGDVAVAELTAQFKAETRREAEAAARRSCGSGRLGGGSDGPNWTDRPACGPGVCDHVPAESAAMLRPWCPRWQRSEALHIAMALARLRAGVAEGNSRPHTGSQPLGGGRPRFALGRR
jgi:hypothetical protein